MAHTKLKIFADGGARGNPGPAAAGFVITNANDETLESDGVYLGETTNNQAEYQAVKLALERAAKYSPTEINFYLDSELVVKQLNGQYKVKNAALKPRVEEIKMLINTFPKVSFSHVFRAQNKLADKQVNIALDNQLKKSL